MKGYGKAVTVTIYTLALVLWLGTPWIYQLYELNDWSYHPAIPRIYFIHPGDGWQDEFDAADDNGIVILEGFYAVSRTVEIRGSMRVYGLGYTWLIAKSEDWPPLDVQLCQGCLLSSVNLGSSDGYCCSFIWREKRGRSKNRN